MVCIDDNGNVYVNGKIEYNVVDDAKTGRTNLSKKEILKQKEQKIEKECKNWINERFELMLNTNNLCNKCG